MGNLNEIEEKEREKRDNSERIIGTIVGPATLLFSLVVGLMCGAMVYFDMTLEARVICMVLALSGIPGFLVYTSMSVNHNWTQALFELNRMTALATAFYSLVFLNLIFANIRIPPYDILAASNYFLFGAYSASHFANYVGLFILWRRQTLWLWVLRFPYWLNPLTLRRPGPQPPTGSPSTLLGVSKRKGRE